MIGTGHLTDLKAGRELIRRSFDFRIFEPQDTTDWDSAYARFTKLLAANA
jgi:rhamnulokinase